MTRIGKIEGSGGFSAAVLREEEDTMIARVRVRPPRWVADLAISREAMLDQQYLDVTFNYAVESLVGEILKNPLIAGHVDRMVSAAVSEARRRN